MATVDICLQERTTQHSLSTQLSHIKM